MRAVCRLRSDARWLRRRVARAAGCKVRFGSGVLGWSELAEFSRQCTERRRRRIGWRNDRAYRRAERCTTEAADQPRVHEHSARSVSVCHDRVPAVPPPEIVGGFRKPPGAPTAGHTTICSCRSRKRWGSRPTSSASPKCAPDRSLRCAGERHVGFHARGQYTRSDPVHARPRARAASSHLRS